MTLSELLEAVEIQGEYKVVYFDEEKTERVEVSPEAVADSTIQYIYPEKDYIYIEVEKQG